MPTDVPDCPRCEDAMEPGFLIDHGYGTVYPAAWVAGIAEWSRWLGTRLKGKTKLPVTTFRCRSCGRLESFAREENWPG
jgi:hypothetical protein